MKLNGNGVRRPDEIEAEIARTRSDLDQTLSAIESRLTPGQLMDQGLHYVRNSSARQYFSNLGEAARTDPIPLALVGVGLAWLMMSSGRSRMPAADEGLSDGQTVAGVKERVSETVHGVAEAAASARERVGQMSGSARERVTHLGESARERMSTMSESARERVSRLGESARERVGRVSGSARHGAERVRGSVDYLVKEQPLALGALGLAIGAVLAAMTPRTRHEERLLGRDPGAGLDDAERPSGSSEAPWSTSTHAMRGGDSASSMANAPWSGQAVGVTGDESVLAQSAGWSRRSPLVSGDEPAATDSGTRSSPSGLSDDDARGVTMASQRSQSTPRVPPEHLGRERLYPGSFAQPVVQPAAAQGDRSSAGNTQAPASTAAGAGAGARTGGPQGEPAAGARSGTSATSGDRSQEPPAMPGTS